MEPSKEGRRTLEQTVVHWRSVGLIGACLAGGLTLTVMVIGSTPTIGGPIAAATEAVVAPAAAVDPSTTLLIDPATTEMTPDSTEVPADPVQELLAAPALVETAPVSPGPAVPVAAPVAAPVTPTAPTAVVPAPAQPTAQPAPNPRPTAAPATPVLTAAPSAAPTTPPAPAPTTPPTTPPRAAPTTPPTPAPTTPPTTTPPPTTAAPTTAPALTYPSYTVSGVAGVTLQFDGSSISVASLSPQANWVYEIAKNGPRSVEIKFFNVATGSDREFHATVEGGRIKVEN